MGSVDILNPFNLKKINQLKLHSENEALKMLEKAESISLNKNRWINKSERIDILKRFKSIVIQNKNFLIQQAVEEGGKPITDTRVEIERGINGIDLAIESIKNLAGIEIPMNISSSSQGKLALTQFRPRGVVLGISAFNHPFNLIIHQVIPAIAAGCPVIIKPASSTPLSCHSIINYLHEAGLEKDYAQFLFCSREVAEKLVSHPCISFFSFIGSAQVGWYLKSKLPPGATCTLEHGGVAPVIIDHEIDDLDKCTNSLIKGGFYHAGQVCVSTQKFYIHEKIYTQFSELFLEKVKKINSGDPMNTDTLVGPLIETKELTRVDEWVQKAIQQGSECLIGGESLSESVYAPTVLRGFDPQSFIAQNEIFGPVVLLKSFNDFDQVIKEANQSNFAFQASIFTKNLDRAFNASQNLEGQTIMINDHTAFRVDWMPFGGYKQSGIGLGGIEQSIKDMSIEKMTVINSKYLV
jgi:acyl-CoA reductase-like NAD-dependent aldehyde dehydrogenase